MDKSSLQYRVYYCLHKSKKHERMPVFNLNYCLNIRKNSNENNIIDTSKLFIFLAKFNVFLRP